MWWKVVIIEAELSLLWWEDLPGQPKVASVQRYKPGPGRKTTGGTKIPSFEHSSCPRTDFVYLLRGVPTLLCLCACPALSKVVPFAAAPDSRTGDTDWPPGRTQAGHGAHRVVTTLLSSRGGQCHGDGCWDRSAQAGASSSDYFWKQLKLFLL